MRALALSSLLVTAMMAQEGATVTQAQAVKLPAPATSSFTLDDTLKQRMSSRKLTGPALDLQTLSQLLWSAQGENRPGSRASRTVPSAGARYPLELYVIVADSKALPGGAYKYSSKEHSLTKVKDGNPKSLMGDAIGGQAWVAEAPAVFLVAGIYSRLADRYGDRHAELWTYWESGAALQSMSLKVAALGLGATVVGGAIDMEALHKTLGLQAEEKINMLFPVGRIKK